MKSENLQDSAFPSSAAASLKSILTPERIALDLHISSKKRLFEEMAALLLKDTRGVDRDTVFKILTDRERLGTTGIGQGVALPHGRVNGLENPLGAVATLKRPLDYDSPDDIPVDFVFGLLVPAQATDDHLLLLSAIATALSNPAIRKDLQNCHSTTELYARLTEV